MNFIFLHSSLFLIFLLSFFSIAHAERFHDKDGHEIEIMWKLKGTDFKAWGKISSGKKNCKQLNYSINFRNSESNRYVYIDGFIKNYRPTGINSYKASSRVRKRSRSFKQKSDKNTWFVKSYYIDCLN